MDLNFIIKDILTRKEGVVVPGLGSFITEYKSARIQQQKKVIRPPRKEIRFNPDIHTDDDQILANYISSRENITLTKAQSHINNFVNEVNRQLSREGQYDLKGIGTLRKDDKSKTELVTEGEIESDLGFEEISAEAFELEPSKYRGKDTATPPPVRKRSGKRIIIWTSSVVLLLLILAGGYYIGFFDYLAYKMEERTKPERQAVRTKPEKEEQGQSEVPAEDTSVPDEIKQAVDEMTDKKKALMYQETKDPNTYYIVAGSFRVRENAREFKNQLQNQGFSAEILEKDNLYRVTVRTFDKKEDALVELYKMRDKGRLKSIWLLTVQGKDR